MQDQLGKCIAITSGKGGVGKSSVSAGVGAALARMGRKALLIDADIGLRSLDIILGVAGKSVHDWGDALSGTCYITQAILDVDTVKNLSLLCAPRSGGADAVKFGQMCEKLREAYDYILIDSAAGIGSGFELAVSAADSVLVIVSGDVISMRTADTVRKILDERFGKPVRMIINRFEGAPVKGEKLPNIDEVIDGAGIRLIGVVPYDRQIMFCAGKGVPVSPKSKAGRAFERIAGRVAGEEIPIKNLDKM